MITSCKIEDISNDNFHGGYQEAVRKSRIKILPEDIKSISSLKSVMCSVLELQSRLLNISYKWFGNICKLHLCQLCLNTFLCKMKSSKKFISYEYSNVAGTTVVKWKLLQHQKFLQMQSLFVHCWNHIDWSACWLNTQNLIFICDIYKPVRRKPKTWIKHTHIDIQVCFNGLYKT